MQHEAIHEAGSVSLATEELAEQFFAPMSVDLVDQLIGQRNAMVAVIKQLAELVSGVERSRALGYFLDNLSDISRCWGRSVSRMFGVEGAIQSLDADMWQRTLNHTDILDTMPAGKRQAASGKRQAASGKRQEWGEQIRQKQTPPYE